MESNKRLRRFKIPTVRSLDNIAVHYLSRYAASEFSLRRVLENRLRRAAGRNAEFSGNDMLQNELRVAIDSIVDKHKKSGVLNDVAYAEMKTASLRRAGRSARAIKVKLSRRGIAVPLIERSLEQSAEGMDAEAVELKAAMALARRRRLGPFRTKDGGPEAARKDLAALARAGFSFAIAKQVLGKNVDEADDL